MSARKRHARGFGAISVVNRNMLAKRNSQFGMMLTVLATVHAVLYGSTAATADRLTVSPAINAKLAIGIDTNASTSWTAGASVRFPAGLSQTELSARLAPLLGSSGNRFERKERLRALAREGTIGFVPRDPQAGAKIPVSKYQTRKPVPAAH